mgnify:CR=1 FL=1
MQAFYVVVEEDSMAKRFFQNVGIILNSHCRLLTGFDGVNEIDYFLTAVGSGNSAARGLLHLNYFLTKIIPLYFIILL